MRSANLDHRSTNIKAASWPTRCTVAVFTDGASSERYEGHFVVPTLKRVSCCGVALRAKLFMRTSSLSQGFGHPRLAISEIPTFRKRKFFFSTGSPLFFLIARSIDQWKALARRGVRRVSWRRPWHRNQRGPARSWWRAMWLRSPPSTFRCRINSSSTNFATLQDRHSIRFFPP